jgi:thioredoxin-dependent peroxiredoxin
VVYGVNPGGEKNHEQFRAKLGLPFPLLSDPGGRLARRYHAGGRIVRRTVYLIGPDGRIRFARRGMPSSAEVLAAI